MFLNVKNGITYITRKGQSPQETCNFLKLTAPPRSAGKAAEIEGDFYYSAGVSLVAQYIESFMFRMKQYSRIENEILWRVHEKAYELDEALAGNGVVPTASESFPSCGSIMNSFIELKCINHVKGGVGYVQNNIDDIKYFIYQYKSIIVEMKATDQVLNLESKGDNLKNQYELCEGDQIGNVQSDDFTKGFIACGYDNTYIYLQNNLGTLVGSNGFHRMKWSAASKLIVKCCLFNLS